MDQTIIIAIIIAVVVIVVVCMFRDRIMELVVDGKQAKMTVKMDAKAKNTETEDEKPVDVVFKGEKVSTE